MGVGASDPAMPIGVPVFIVGLTTCNLLDEASRCWSVGGQLLQKTQEMQTWRQMMEEGEVCPLKLPLPLLLPLEPVADPG